MLADRERGLLAEQELELIDYLDVVWRWRWLIAATTLANVLTAAAVVGMVLPPAYTAAVTTDAGTPRNDVQTDVVKQLTSNLERKWDDKVVVTSPAPGRVRLQATAASPGVAESTVRPPLEDVRHTLGRLGGREQERVKCLEREPEHLRTVESTLRAAQLKSLARTDPQGLLFLADHCRPNLIEPCSGSTISRKSCEAERPPSPRASSKCREHRACRSGCW